MFLANELHELGLPYFKMRMNRILIELRRGAYLVGDGLNLLTPDELHEWLMKATWLQLRKGGVLCGTSAAVLHGLPVPWSHLSVVEVVRPTSSGRWPFESRYLNVCIRDLRDDEVAVVEHLPVTSVARTLVDVARTWPLERVVAAADYAVRHEMTTVEELSRVAKGLGRLKGVARSRNFIDLIDPRSESVGESVSRVQMIEAGLTPVPQHEVVCEEGTFRSDFLQEKAEGGQDVLAEFDGEAKDSMNEELGVTREMAVTRREWRDRQLEAKGYAMVHFGWRDLAQPDGYIGRISEASGVPVTKLGPRPFGRSTPCGRPWRPEKVPTWLAERAAGWSPLVFPKKPVPDEPARPTGSAPEPGPAAEAEVAVRIEPASHEAAVPVPRTRPGDDVGVPEPGEASGSRQLPPGRRTSGRAAPTRPLWWHPRLPHLCQRWRDRDGGAAA